MAILTTKNIAQRIFQGLEELKVNLELKESHELNKNIKILNECFQSKDYIKLKNEISSNKFTITNEQLENTFKILKPLSIEPKNIQDFVEKYKKEKKCLFIWDDIPGSSDVNLIKFLRQNFGIDWLKTAKIEKIDSDRTIKVSTEKNYLSLKLNDEQTKVILKIDDGRTDKLVVKIENNKVNIYEKFPIIFSSLDVEKIRPANFDLRLGNEYFVSREKYPKQLEKTGDFLVIEPGDFAILTTHEYIYVPDDLLGLISLRNTYKKLGIINISGFHVDPGYAGRLFFSVYNSGPEKVVLKHKETVFMIMFDALEEPVLKGYGIGKDNITTDLISGLIGYSISPTRLKSRIDSLELQLRILVGIVIALLVAVVAQILKI